ncbi:DUF1120 domain-containing protein [Enterobacter soli]|uniref:DUF1120 domain-containing protein n=1 Tax=Enterobacter soli TaxID=885040 RepID=UPI0034CD1F03
MTTFNKKLSALAICAAAIASANVNAAPETTLTVAGKFIPAACVPTLANSGKVDFGSMNMSTIATATEGNSLVQLERKTINLTVTCDAATAVGVVAQDNRTSSRVALSNTAYIEDYATTAGDNMKISGPAFGLGATTDSKNIGSYIITALPTGLTVDGKSAGYLIKDTDSAQGWLSVDAGGPFYPDGSRIVTVADAGKTTPKYFTEMVMPLYIAAGVQTKAQLGESTEISLDGNATLSLVYL